MYIYIHTQTCVSHRCGSGYRVETLDFNSLLFWTYFFSFSKFLCIAFKVSLLPLSSWTQRALKCDILHMGDIHIRSVWGTSITNRQCWIFLDEPQFFFYACLSFHLSVHFDTYLDLIMHLFCLLDHLIYHHSSLDFLYEIMYYLLGQP